jgi:hypothetical protein
MQLVDLLKNLFSVFAAYYLEKFSRKTDVTSCQSQEDFQT